MKIINCTPHPIRFVNREGEVYFVEKSGYTLQAKAVETPVGEMYGAELVKTTFIADEPTLVELAEIQEKYPAHLIVGSIISAQALPGQVVCLVSAPGFERAAPEDKQFLDYKFSSF